MELSEYIKLVQKNKVKILVWALSLGLVAHLIALFSSTRYAVSVDFMVGVAHRQPVAEYQYDGYYAMMSSDLAAKTIMSWFKTPSFVMDVLERADVKNRTFTSLKSFSNLFKTVKFSAQNVAVKFQMKDESEARRLAEAVISAVETKSQELNRDSEGYSVFEVNGSTPVVVAVKADRVLFFVVGFMVGLLGILLALPLSCFVKSEK